jgi:hypothetical protein
MSICFPWSAREIWSMYVHFKSTLTGKNWWFLIIKVWLIFYTCWVLSSQVSTNNIRDKISIFPKIVDISLGFISQQSETYNKYIKIWFKFDIVVGAVLRGLWEESSLQPMRTHSRGKGWPQFPPTFSTFFFII